MWRMWWSGALVGMSYQYIDLRAWFMAVPLLVASFAIYMWAMWPERPARRPWGT